MGRSAVVFPGQGAQKVGMGREFFDSSPRGRAVFERANRVLGFDLAAICFDGSEARLEQTDLQQPAIFTTSLAIWEAYLEGGGSLDSFAFAGGLSLGEYTALCAAGAIAFDDAVRLVRRRGELMQAASEVTASGMISLVGADESQAADLCQKSAQGEILAPANFNCPGQIVIAGNKAACDRAISQAEADGLKAVRLAVAGAFHTPIMASAAAGLRETLDETEISTPRIPVIANVSAEFHGGPADIRRALCEQLTHPVLWQNCVQRLIADGATTCVEFGPGRVLTGLLRKIDRGVTGVNLGTQESVTAFVKPTREAPVTLGAE